MIHYLFTQQDVTVENISPEELIGGTKSTLTLQYDSLLVSDIQPFGDEEDIGQFGLFEERKYIKP
ncbi:MAG: hypothetical protein ACI9K1_001976, partial [Arcticibacterium sp.]